MLKLAKEGHGRPSVGKPHIDHIRGVDDYAEDVRHP